MGKIDVKTILIILVFSLVLIAGIVLAAPLISFTQPTPADSYSTTNTSIEINISITESDLKEVIYGWNHTNYTMYNDSLMLLFNFDNVSTIGDNETNTADLSRQQNNGTIAGAVYVAGKYGDAIYFDGQSYINVSGTYPSGTQPRTLCSWMKHDTGIKTGNADHAINYGTYDNNKGFGFMVYDNKWHFYGHGALSDINTGVSVDTNWHHHCVTYDGSTVTYYIDAINKASDGKTLATTSGGFTIGANPSVTDNNNYFNGTIDEVKFWNISLSSENIYQQYASNLNKYDTDKWQLYVNQSKNATDGLSNGTYSYSAYAIDNADSIRSLGRVITINTELPMINLVNLSPELDISYFNNYNITANVTASNPISNVTVNITRVNGENSECGEYYVNGSCVGDDSYYYNLTYVEGNNYLKQYVRPDHMYPQIEFGEDEIFWNNEPENLTLYKNNFHIMHFINNYTFVHNSSLFIESSNVPAALNSNSINVYLVGKGHGISFFNTNWKNHADTELVGSITSDDYISHTHTANSYHYLTRLSPNEDGTFGRKNINVSNDFWVVLYSNAPNTAKGWQLNYRNDSICNNSENWYIGSSADWSTSHQSGCPDVHIHLARRDINYLDGVNISIFANDTSGNSATQASFFSFAELPPVSPTPTAFITPVNGTYNGTINISWERCIDPNGDSVSYNISLINLDGSLNLSIVNETVNLSFLFDTTLAQNGVYDLIAYCFDSGGLTSNFTVSQDYDNFTIFNNIAPQINFTSPTPENNTNTSNTSVQINVSIIYNNMSAFIYNWNSVNYTIYDNESLVLMYNFENKSELGENNSYIADISTYKNDANCTKCPSWTSSGKHGGAYEFDGIDDSVSLPNDASVNMTNQMSVMFWMKATPPVDYSAIPISHGEYQNSWWFEYYNDGLQFYTTLDGAGVSGSTKIRFVPDSWYHVAGTYNSTDGSQKFYINGTLVGSSTFSGTLTTSDTPLYLSFAEESGYGEHHLNGTLDEVKIWNRSLSADEIYLHYASSLLKHNESQWNYYINQSGNTGSDLAEASYTYSANLKDAAGSLTSTSVRTLNIIYPTIGLLRVFPASNLTLKQYDWLNYTAEVCCYDIDCGQINSTLKIYGPSLYNSSSLITQDSDSGNDTITANAENPPSEVKEDAFDQSISTKWLAHYNQTGWIKIHLGNGQKRMWKYELCSANDADGRDPNNWTITGSNDGTSWTLLDNVTDNGVFASRNTCYPFYPDSIGSYEYYMLNITENNGDEHMQLSEIKYYDQSLSYTNSLVSTVEGAENFYTNVTNPYNTSPKINECSNITWFVNATNQAGSSALFFVDSNKTTMMSISNSTDNLNVTIVECIVDGDCSENDICSANYCVAPSDYPPQINFTSPTPENNTNTTNTSVQINVSITEANLSSLTYNWNGTNYSLYDDSLILMYNFDNVSALGENNTYVLDMSRSGINGLVNGNPGFNRSNKKYGRSFDMDGVDDYLNVSLVLPSNGTISLWYYPEPWYDYQTIFDNTVHSDDWEMWIYSDGRLRSRIEGDAYVTYDLDNLGGPNNWYHIVFSWTSQAQSWLYVNGELRDSDDGGTFVNPGSQLFFGGWNAENPKGNGSLDEVRIWNRTLSAEEAYIQYVSNLNKYNSTQWYLYVNQSKNASDGLDLGTHTYQAFASDNDSNLNYTEQRYINIIEQNNNCTVCSSGCNYSTIQAAIDGEGIGSNISLCAGTYNENIDIAKSLTLSGLPGAVINCSSSDHCIAITSDDVNVSWLNVTGARASFKAGIYITADRCWITNNKVFNNNISIYLTGDANYNHIAENNVSQSEYYGIHLSNASHNNVSLNYLFNNTDSIYVLLSANNSIYNNTLFNTTNRSISLSRSDDCYITSNYVHGPTAVGLDILLSHGANISHNQVYNVSQYLISIIDSKNITEFDNHLEDSTLYGMFFSGVYTSNIFNNTITRTARQPVYIQTYYNNTFANNSFYNNSIAGGYGPFSISEACNNTFYNNLINSTWNTTFALTGYNSFNTSNHTGLNINSGNIVGGNLWLSPTGTGYSETCDDVNSDGICDSYYELTTNNIDYYPLAKVTGQISSDLISPTINLLYPTNTSYPENISALNFTYAETNPNSCWYELNGITTIMQACTNLTNVTYHQGQNNLTLFMNDTSGNKANDTIQFMLDSVNPNASLVYPADNYVNTTNQSIPVYFRCSAQDNVLLSNISLYITGSDNQTLVFNSSSSLSGISDYASWTITMDFGAYTWNCMAFDSLGNSDWSQNRTLVINQTDQTPPKIGLIAGTTRNGIYSQSTISVAVSAVDPDLSFINITLYNSTGLVNYSISNTSYTSLSYTGLADGIYYLNATARDTYSNTNRTETRRIILDTTAPNVISILPLHLANQTSNTATVAFNTTDNIDSSMNCSLYLNYFINDILEATNSSTQNSTYSTFITGSLLNKTYSWYVNCTDDAGNTGKSSVRTLSIDPVPPQITVTTPKTGDIIGYLVYIRTDISDQITGVNTAWYHIVNQSNNSQLIYSGLLNQTGNWDSVWNTTSYANAEMDLLLTIYANDSAGNTAENNITFTLDNINPSIQMIAPGGEGDFYSTDYNMSIIVQDTNLNTSDYNVTMSGITSQFNATTLTGQQLFTWTDLINLSNYIEGNYTINISVNDSASNSKNITSWFIIDRISPNVTLVSPVNGFRTTNTTINFSWIATDNVSSVMLCNLSINSNVIESDISSPNGSITSYIVQDFSWSDYYWNVTCKDAASNINDPETILFIPNFRDNDNDGVHSSVDNLEGNESNVSVEGITDLDIVVGNETNLTTFNDTKEIVFYSGSNPVINFTHNFSAKKIELAKAAIIKTNDSLIINVSELLETGKKKTMYIDDNNFVRLCVKDAPVTNISQISQGCDGVDEVNFTSCIGNSSGVTINGLTCYDEGAKIRIENLSYSAAKGTVGSTTSTTSVVSSTSGSGSGGISYCGDGICSPAIIENYSNCPQDCSKPDVVFDATEINDSLNYSINDSQHEGYAYNYSSLNNTPITKDNDVSDLPENKSDSFFTSWKMIIITIVFILLISLFLIRRNRRKNQKEMMMEDLNY